MIKNFINRFIPNSILKSRQKYLIKKQRNKFAKSNMRESFREYYFKTPGFKDGENYSKFDSGPGSHVPEVVSIYLNEVENFLKSLSKKPDVVDLGCGDFYIGSKLRKLCNNYIAADIVDELISFNKEKYKLLNVEFRNIDITRNELPSGDICFVRQILQHMSNKSILGFLKSVNKYKYLIVTEHWPLSKNFVPNIDKPDGTDIRVYDESGVVLTAPPFNLKVIKDIDLCEVRVSDVLGDVEGIIKTKILQLKN